MGRHKLTRVYCEETSGQVAIWFALMALPLLASLTFVLDYQNAQVERTKLRTAMDASVIAAVNNNKLTLSQKEDFAAFHFKENYSGKLEVDYKAVADDSRVEATVEAGAPISISSAFGLDTIPLYHNSAAEISSSNIICVLALSETANGAVSILGQTEYTSETCSVQSNSISTSAINSRSTTIPRAKSFCAVGGVQGSFYPAAKGECKKIEDPYKNTPPAIVGACKTDEDFVQMHQAIPPIIVSVAEGTNNALQGLPNMTASLLPPDYNPVTDLGTSLPDLNKGESANVTNSNSVMTPGTYCGGLTVNGENVLFLPGDYIIKDGPLTLKGLAQANADRVTFSFTGLGARLQVLEGSEFTIRAPKDGPRKGLAFMEMPNNGVPGNRNRQEILNSITTGGKLNVNGTIYFPNMPLEVKGEGNVGAKAPATSFIADTIAFKGPSGTKVTVRVNHTLADLPPVLPKAEAGARLVE